MNIDRAKRTSGKPTSPISLAVMKSYLGVNHSQQDETITNMCDAALGLFERLTRRAIVQSEWTLTLDSFPGGGLGWWDGVKDGARTQDNRNTIEIPYPSLISVDEIRTTDLSNTTTVFADTNYYMDNSDPDQPGRVILNFGCIWPVNLRYQNAIAIDYVAGYEEGSIPGEILEALKMMVAHMWMTRGGCDEAGCTACGAYGMINPFIIYYAGATR